jgi:hypothetical protein
VTAKTIYARRRGQAVISCVGLLVLAAVAHSHGSNGLAIGLVVFAGLTVLFLLRRPRLRVDSRGLIVANLARTYRIPWTDIEGFGYGSEGAVPCLTIHRRDGTVVKAAVVTDDFKTGYSSSRVEEMIEDLQDRLALATGTEVDRRLEAPRRPGVEPRTRSLSRRVQVMAPLLVWVFLLVFGIVITVNATSNLPHTYSYLRSHGVPATATFAGCRVTGIRDHQCRLTLTYLDRARTWTYSEDYSQFDRLPFGAPVAVLVDPRHPGTVYTAHDVETRFNAGLGPLAILGIVFAIVGTLGLGAFFVVWRRRRR